MTLSIECLHADCCYGDCYGYLNTMLSVVMLNVIMISVVMLSVVMLNVVMLIVVAPVGPNLINRFDFPSLFLAGPRLEP